MKKLKSRKTGKTYKVVPKKIGKPNLKLRNRKRIA